MSKRTVRALLAGALLVTGLGAAGLSPAQAAIPALVQVGANPAAASQTSAMGKSVSDMEVFQGRVYLGSGDWVANTGPTPIYSYDPTTGAFTREFDSGTEAIQRFGVVGGALYAPATDRRTADLAVRTADGTWQDRTGLGSEHVFDVETSNGTDVFLAGSLGTSGVVWRSTDAGVTWTRSLVVPRALFSYNRFYDLHTAGGKVWAQSTEDATAWVFNGTSWSRTSLNLKAAGLSQSITFAGRVIGTVMSTGTIKNGTFNGTTTGRLPYAGPNTVSGGKLYTLNLANRTVYATTNLSLWTAVATAPADAQSLAVTQDGTILVGTVTGGVWASRAPQPAAVVTSPTAEPASTSTVTTG